MSHTALIGYFAFKKLFGSRTDDWVDKLNHGYTVSLLIVFATVISTVQLTGEPIHCWVPAEFTTAYDNYAKAYCWIKNTYYVPSNDVIPTDETLRQESELTYYQWVPLLLLFMAFLFKVPHMFWKIMNTKTGLNIHRLCDLADKSFCDKDERIKTIDGMTHFLDNWLTSQHYYQHNFITRAKTRVASICCIFCSKRDGKYLSALYIWIKIGYVVNVISMFYILNVFLGMDFNSLGYEVINTFSLNEGIRESPRFPRITMCDFKIRLLQNIKNYTIQCVLPINLFNEKIFIFLWFWFFVLATLSSVNLCKWFYILIVKKNNYEFVKKFLKISKTVQSEEDKRLCQRFTSSYLRDDGCFIMRMLVLNSCEMVVIDLIDEMFKRWREKHKAPYKAAYGDIPYIDDCKEEVESQ